MSDSDDSVEVSFKQLRRNPLHGSQQCRVHPPRRIPVVVQPAVVAAVQFAVVAAQRQTLDDLADLLPMRQT